MSALDTLLIPPRVLASALLSGGLVSALVVEGKLRVVGAERRDLYTRTWARGLLRALSVDIVLDPPGFCPLPAHGEKRLVVANHRSTIDIFLMLHLFGGHLLARGDMEHWPVMGRLAQLAGTLFVDRKDASSGAAAVRKVKDHLERGVTIGVFPEGTTFADDEVRPFHAGAFMAIARVRGDVLPVGLAYDGQHALYKDEPIGDHFRRVLTARRTRVAVAIGDSIPSTGLGISALRDRAHEAVQALVHQARGRL